MKYFMVLLLLATFTHTAAFADELAKNTTEQSAVQRLADVKKIFVGMLGDAKGSELVRQNIMNALIESKVVIVVDSPEEADATLTGIGQAHSYLPGGTNFARAVIRLIGKNKQVLWAGEGKPGLFCPRLTAYSVSSSAANKVVKSLIQAIKKDQEIAQIDSTQHNKPR